MKVDLEKLKAMSPEKRAQLYENARKMKDEGGQAIIDMIDASGLPLRSGGMSLNDPAYLRMEEIVWSAAGTAGLIRATEQGLPALAGVEPMICDELGSRYNPHDQGTANAGWIVAERMRNLGYVASGSSGMPKGSVAKTALMWKPRSQ